MPLLEQMLVSFGFVAQIRCRSAFCRSVRLNWTSILPSLNMRLLNVLVLFLYAFFARRLRFEAFTFDFVLWELILNASLFLSLFERGIRGILVSARTRNGNNNCPEFTMNLHSVGNTHFQPAMISTFGKTFELKQNFHQ